MKNHTRLFATGDKVRIEQIDGSQDRKDFFGKYIGKEGQIISWNYLRREGYKYKVMFDKDNNDWQHFRQNELILVGVDNKN